MVVRLDDCWTRDVSDGRMHERKKESLIKADETASFLIAPEITTRRRRRHEGAQCVKGTQRRDREESSSSSYSRYCKMHKQQQQQQEDRIRDEILLPHSILLSDVSELFSQVKKPPTRLSGTDPGVTEPSAHPSQCSSIKERGENKQQHDQLLLLLLLKTDFSIKTGNFNGINYTTTAMLIN